MTVTLDITRETESRLKRLAETVHQPVEATLNAALDALEAKVGQLPAKRILTPEEKRVAIERAVARIRELPVLDNRPADELLGYDENGLPS
jgi:antitoxin VapB